MHVKPLQSLSFLTPSVKNDPVIKLQVKSETISSDAADWFSVMSRFAAATTVLSEAFEQPK